MTTSTKAKNEKPQEPEKPEGRLDETVPGGRYEVNGKIVDANGQPVKD